jgi:hypothetical protein
MLRVAGLSVRAAPAAAQRIPTLEFAFSEVVTLGETVSLGAATPGERVIMPFTGGSFEGPGIRGTIEPGA